MQKILLALALIICLPVSAAYTENPYVSIEEMKSPRPFSADLQMRTLQAALHFKNIPFDESKPLPSVMISEEIEDPQVIKEVEAQGMPAWALKKGVNIYIINLNIVIVHSRIHLHQLAHEYAHYVQLIYEGYTPEDAASDYLELDAVRIQDMFRD